MNVLKKYTWLVGTLMRTGDKGLTLEQIGDRWNVTEELHEEGAFVRRSFHRHRSEIMDLFGIEIECYVDGGQYRYRLTDEPSLVDAAADHLDSVWQGTHCAKCKRKAFCGDRIG